MLRGLILLFRALGFNGRMSFGSILVIVGVLMSFLTFSQVKTNVKTPVELDSLAVDEVEEGLYIEASTDICYGSCMEYTSGKHDQTLYEYYVVPLVRNGEEYYICAKVSASNTTDFFNVSLATDQYFANIRSDLADAISFEGNLEKMDAEETKYYNEWFEEAGFSDSEIEEYVLPYYVNTSTSQDAGVAAFMGLITAALLGAGIALFVFGLKAKKRLKEEDAQVMQQFTV